MNFDRIISMIFRQVLNRGIRAGINKGADMMTPRGQAGETAESRDQAKKTTKRAQQAVRMGRRIGRM